ncbi:MAG: threonylcarbamoyl-AMP synthase [Candidatus Aenigmarchaeota archaeon]|nr:threonylcarbamoyl-AMP synthase [Candidatus Aenigmarchaeota archaeon]
METLVLHVSGQGLREAVKILKGGGVLVYPTETAYGIGCDATNRKAVKKVYCVKKRSPKKPLSVIFGSLENAKKYVNLDKTGARLVKAFMPGPLTLVARPKKRLAGSPKNEIAFRIPSGLFARSLAKEFGRPVTATSANISGEKPVYAFKDAFNLFNGKVNAIIDAGSLPRRRVSTVFNLASMEIARKGAVSESKIKRLLQNRA